jgi:peptide deformylase
MPIYPIRVFPDPVLRTKTTPITEFGPELARLIDDMLEVMYEAPGVGPAGRDGARPLQASAGKLILSAAARGAKAD